MPSRPLQTVSPVLALHGSASSGKQWRALQTALEGKRRVLAPDLLGYGDTGGSRQQEDSRLEPLLALVDGLPQPADVVAHSFGGAVAMMLAERRPECLRSITVFDPIVPAQNTSGGAALPKELDELRTDMGRLSPDAAMSAFLTFWAGPGIWEALDLKQRARLLEQHALVARDFREVAQGLWTPGSCVFDGPIHILSGARSPVASGEMCLRLMRDYTQASLETLSDFGHLTPLTDPIATCEVVLRCLARLDAKRADAFGSGAAD